MPGKNDDAPAAPAPLALWGGLTQKGAVKKAGSAWREEALLPYE